MRFIRPLYTTSRLLEAKYIGPHITTPLKEKKIPLDKNIYVEMLKADGFSPEQANGLVNLVEEAIKESMHSASQTMVQKVDQEQFASEMNKDLNHLRDEIQLLERKDFAVLRGELDRIVEHVARIKANMRDDINRIHGGVRLDTNLEKSRITDESGELTKLLKQAGIKFDGRRQDR